MLVSPTMPLAESHAWRPHIRGWSDDILPFYSALARGLLDGATVVEVGVAFGRSVLFLAEKLAALGKHKVRIVAVDSWAGESEGIFAGAFGAFCRHLGEASLDERRLVHPLRLESSQAARLFKGQTVDVLFLDGDHHREAVLDDLDAWGRHASIGLWAGHDYGAYEPGVVEAVNAQFGKPDRVDGFVWQVQGSTT